MLSCVLLIIFGLFLPSGVQGQSCTTADCTSATLLTSASWTDQTWQINVSTAITLTNDGTVKVTTNKCTCTQGYAFYLYDTNSNVIGGPAWINFDTTTGDMVIDASAQDSTTLLANGPYTVTMRTTFSGGLATLPDVQLATFKINIKPCGDQSTCGMTSSGATWTDQTWTIGTSSAISLSNDASISYSDPANCGCAESYFIKVVDGTSATITPGWITFDATANPARLTIDASSEDPTALYASKDYTLSLYAEMPDGVSIAPITLSRIKILIVDPNVCGDSTTCTTLSWSPFPTWAAQTWYLGSATAISLSNDGAISMDATCNCVASFEIYQVNDGNAGAYLASVPAWVTMGDAATGDISIDASSETITSVNADNTFQVEVRGLITIFNNVVMYSDVFKFDVNIQDRCYAYVQTETPAPSWANPMVNYIEDATTDSYTFDGYSSALPAECAGIVTFGFQAYDSTLSPISSSFFSLDATTGDFTFDGSTATVASDWGTSYTIEMWYVFDDNAGTSANSNLYSWGANFDSKCYSNDGSTFVSTIDYTTPTLVDMTINVIGTQSTQTIVFENSESQTQGSASYCGSSRTILISTTHPWLTIDGANNKIICHSTDASDTPGTFTVEIQQVLVDYEGVSTQTSIQGTTTFQVTLNPCTITSVTIDTANSDAVYGSSTLTVYTHTTGQVYPFPAIQFSPACSVTLDRMYAKAGGSLVDNTQFTNTVQEAGTQPSSLTWEAWTNDGTQDSASITLEIYATLDATCVGTCADQLVFTLTLNWLHLCRTTAISLPSASIPTQLTTSELAAAQLNTVNAYFTNSVATSQGDATFCGAYTASIFYDAADGYDCRTVYTVDTTNAPTSFDISFESTSLGDSAIFLQYIPCQLMVTLTDWTTVAAAYHQIDTEVTYCVPSLTWDYSGTPTLSTDKTFTIGTDTTPLSWDYPTYTESPACLYTYTYSLDIDSGAGTIDTNGGSTSYLMLSTTTAGTLSYSVTTADNTLIKSYTISQITATSQGPDAQTWDLPSVSTWTLTIDSVCLTATFNDPGYTHFAVGQLNSGARDLSISDDMSVTYGNNDGFTLCGTRTYTYVFKDSTNAVIAQPSFFTFSAETLTFAPLATDAITSYSIEVDVCLDDILPYPTLCTSTPFVMTAEIIPCEVTSYSWSGTIATINHVTFDSGLETFTLPTFTQTPSCLYNQQYTVVQSDGSATPIWFTLNADGLTDFTINSQDLADVGTYTLEFQMFLTDYPNVHATDYSVTPVIFGQVTVNILHPCTLTTFNLPTLSTIVTTPLRAAGAEIQYFQEPSDSKSLLFDSNLVAGGQTNTWYKLLSQTQGDSGTATATYDPVADGSLMCGPRTYSISGGAAPLCSTILTVQETVVGQPSLELISTTNADVGTWTCNVDISLQNYPTVTGTVTVSVQIDWCIVTNFALTAGAITTVQEYILADTMFSVPTPTYTQTPACGYSLSISCVELITDASTSIYPAGQAWTSADVQSAPVANLQAIATCNAASYDVYLNTATLEGFQYQGDYHVQVTATLSDPNNPTLPNQFDSSHEFIMRLTNPCKYQTFDPINGHVYNTITASTIPQLNTQVLMIPDQSISFTNFVDSASSTYGNMATPDGYSLCGTRSYALSPTYAAFLTLTLTSQTQIDVTAHPTLTSEIGYTGFTQPCWTPSVIATFDNPNYVDGSLVALQGSGTLTVCIEECMVTSFTPDTAFTSAYTYNIWADGAQYVAFPSFTQVPACGYTLSMSATIEKTQAPNSVSDPVFSPAEVLTTSSHYALQTLYDAVTDWSYIQFYAAGTGATASYPNGYLFLRSNRPADNGEYVVTVSISLAEQDAKGTYAYSSYTHATVFPDYSTTLTYTDPCESALLNDVGDTTYHRQPVDMQISVGGPADTQNIYQFTDSVSILYDTTNTAVASSATGVKICGPRSYSFLPSVLATAWLSFDEASDGLITVQSTDINDVMYTDSVGDIALNPTGKVGWRVAITSTLVYYPTVTTTIDFYVKITECVITDFYYGGTLQADITYNLYSGPLITPIVPYVQVPACGYSINMGYNIQGSTSFPTWMLESPTGSWKIESTSMSDAGVFPMEQKATISYILEGVAQNLVATTNTVSQTSCSTITNADLTTSTICTTSLVTLDYMHFTITVNDPCVNAAITPQSGTGETFDSTMYSSFLPIITTSVKYGTDITPSGIAATLVFTEHQDSVSSDPQYAIDPAIRTYACGAREYHLWWEISVGTWVELLDPTNDFMKMTSTGTKQKTFSVSTQDELKRSWQNPRYDSGQTGTHNLKLTVDLVDYLGVVPQVVEYFRIEIQSCIVKQFQKVGMGSAAEATLAGYDQLNPFEFWLYYIPQQQVTINSFRLIPACDYVKTFRIEVLNDTPISSTLWPSMEAARKDDITTPTIVIFTSSVKDLDQATYGVTDPVTQITDYSEPTIKNPFHVNLIAELALNSYNIWSLAHLYSTDPAMPASPTVTDLANFEPIASTGACNREIDFWVWAKDPCRKVTLSVDTNIYNLQVLIYFIYDQEITESFEPTLTSMVLDNDYGNADVCGDIVYTVVQRTNDNINPLSYVISGESTEVATYSEDPSLAGHQLLRVRSSLPSPLDYIYDYADWSVDAYAISSDVKFENQYYQVGSEMGRYTLAIFKLTPTNENFEFIYSLEVFLDDEELDLSVESWIGFDPLTLEVNWDTSDGSKEGNYTVTLVGTVQDKILLTKYAIKGRNTFYLTVSKQPPPITLAILPVLVEELQDQYIIYGGLLNYKIPAAYSEAGYSVSIEASFDKLKMKWLEYAQGSFKISEGTTTKDDIAGYSIKVILTDEIGTKNYLGFMLYIEDEPPAPIPEDLTAKAPWPTVSVNQKGLMTIAWDKCIKVPRNLTETRNSTVPYYDPEIENIIMKPSLEISIVPGVNQTYTDCNFTWDYASWTAEKIFIQLYFEFPLRVGYEAQKEDRAQLKIIFWNDYLFTAKATNIRIQNFTKPFDSEGNDWHVPVSLYRQVPIKDPPEPAVALSVVGDIGQVIMQLTISYFLNNLWSVIQTQQIIVLIPLFADIHMPPATTEFFAFLMEIAAFDIVPTDEPFALVFGTEPPDPVNDQFDEVGFGTTLFWFNLGSLTFAVISFPFIAMLAKCFKKSTSKNVIRKGVSWERNLYWTSQIMILNGSYVILSICTAVNVSSLEWPSYGYYINNLCAIFFFIVCAVFPFFQLHFCVKNFENLLKPEVKKKWGSLYEGNNLKTKGFVFYNFWFLFRRFTLGLVLVFVKEILFVQIFTLVYQTIVAVLIMGSTKPMDFNQSNQMEFFNEIMILFIMYATMCLTNWQTDESIREQAGQVLIMLVLTHVAVNLSLMVYNNIDSWRNQWRKYRLLRKHAKSRGMRNRKIQKKKRRQRFEQVGKQIHAQKPRIEEVELGSQADHYSLREASRNQSEIISSAGLSEQSEINHEGMLHRQPGEAPELGPNKNSLELGQDHTADTMINKRLGQNLLAEKFQPGFEQDVHNSIARKMGEDYAEAQFFKDKFHPRQFGRQAPIEGKVDQAKVEEVLKHNKFGRMAGQDARLRYAQVRPDQIIQERGHRVQADTNAIHNKLFQQIEAGDAAKASSSETYKLKRRKTLLETGGFSSIYGNAKSRNEGGLQRKTTLQSLKNNTQHSLESEPSAPTTEPDLLNLNAPIQMRHRDIYVPPVRGAPPNREPLQQRQAAQVDDFADFDLGDMNADGPL